MWKNCRFTIKKNLLQFRNVNTFEKIVFFECFFFFIPQLIQYEVESRYSLSSNSGALQFSILHFIACDAFAFNVSMCYFVQECLLSLSLRKVEWGSCSVWQRISFYFITSWLRRINGYICLLMVNGGELQCEEFFFYTVTWELSAEVWWVTKSTERKWTVWNVMLQFGHSLECDIFARNDYIVIQNNFRHC